jgi:large subunit ribosomal protein L19e
MTDLRNQKRMAAEVLECGESRVWLDPLHADAIAEAVTRADIRKLVRKGYIKAAQSNGVSRGRARKLKQQKEGGRRKGPGSRKGAKGARDPRKRRWIRVVRPQRALLMELRDGKKITPAQYRHFRKRVKGGAYKSKATLVFHMKTEGVLKEEGAQ